MRAAIPPGDDPACNSGSRFALPAVPTMITYVLVPPNLAALWTGYCRLPLPIAARGERSNFISSSQLHDYRLEIQTTLKQLYRWRMLLDLFTNNHSFWATPSLSPMPYPCKAAAMPARSALIWTNSSRGLQRSGKCLHALDFLNFAGWGTCAAPKRPEANRPGTLTAP